MHFQGIVPQNIAPIMLLMRDSHSAKIWQERFEASGINVSYAAYDPLRTIAQLGVQLRAAGLLVIDLSEHQTPLQHLRELRDIAGAALPIIVIGNSHELGYARQLRQLGASEYYAHPVELDELMQTARSLLHMDNLSSTRNGRMIAVHGLRGGVGSSMIAAGIGSLLSQQYGRNCACVDLNFNTPAIGSWLGCDDPGRLNTLLNDIHRLDHALLEQSRQSPSAQLDVYDGNVNNDDTGPTSIDAPGMHKLAHMLGERHACQIWRTSPDQEVQPILLEADVCVIVTDGSLPALRSAMVWLPWIRNSKPTLRTIVVFNQTRPHMPLNVDQFTDSIGQAPDHILPYQRRLGEQVIGNVPFNRKTHVLHHAMNKLSADLLDVQLPQRPWWKGGWR